MDLGKKLEHRLVIAVGLCVIASREQIDAERLTGERLDLPDGLSDLVGRQIGSAERPKASGVRNRRDKLGCRGSPTHRRLNDGMLDAEPFQKSAFRHLEPSAAHAFRIGLPRPHEKWFIMTEGIFFYDGRRTELGMDASDLAVFSAVARAGGITKAAQSLNTVQSNVTQRIRLLEAELGVPLFHRHSRGVTLTRAGAELLPYAERIGRLIDEAKLAAADGPIPKGRIAIGALETATAVRLPPILSAYATACPEVDIEIKTGTSASLIDDVLARRIEAAFVAGPVVHAELLVVPLIKEELVIVTAPWIADLDQLKAHAIAGKVKIIVFRAGCTYRQHLEDFLAAHGISGVRLLEFGTLDGIVGCVGAGIGITMLPRAAVAKAAAGGSVALHALARSRGRVETVLVRRRDAFVSTALANFIEMARGHVTTRALGRHSIGSARARLPRRMDRLVKAAAASKARPTQGTGARRRKSKA